MADPFAPEHLFEHVQDSDHIEVPRFLAPGGRIEIPQPFRLAHPLTKQVGPLEPLDLRITKFMVLEVVAAVLVAVIFIRLAKLASKSVVPRGKFWNFFEAMLVYLRDQVARPAIGEHDAEKFLPFLWTIFTFVLACNLLGLVPWAGSATGALGTTAALALVTFGVVVGAGMLRLGPIGFWIGQVPHMDLHPVAGYLLKPPLFGIEVIGLFIKHVVLGIRLLANMLGGHLVLAVIMAFIVASYSHFAWYGIAPISAISVLGAVALSMLELLVAFLQAYVFTFLSALFIGMAVHPH